MQLHDLIIILVLTNAMISPATIIYVQWNFSKPDPQKTGSPWMLANFLGPLQPILWKRSLTKPATPLNWPYFLVPVLASLDKFHCISKHVKICWYKLNVSSVAKLWVIIVKIIKRIKVSGENMTTTCLKWQEARLSKVNGNSGTATQYTWYRE
jgi:hypothetical protein